MSNLKKHFFHISKSWFSVCTFIFLLAVCVGLVIHITNKKENATCSNSEAPIVSNGNVSACDSLENGVILLYNRVRAKADELDALMSKAREQTPGAGSIPLP